MRPAMAKALIINAFASTGRFAFINPYTHGGALDYVLIGLSFPNLFPSVFQSFPLCLMFNVKCFEISSYFVQLVIPF